MARRPRIPVQLTNGPFTLEEARAYGITLSALRGRSWERIGARLYRWRHESRGTWAIIDAFRRALPSSAVFVGRTAAWIHGLDVSPTRPVQVVEPSLESRDGLEVRHGDVTGEVVQLRGIQVTSLQRTLLDLCLWLPGVEALVLIDMAIRRVSLATLSEYANVAHGRPGASRLRRLLDIAAPAESPMETRLRYLLIEHRLPTPEVQTDLYDDYGQFLGRADLYYPTAHLVIEFDGGNHRDRLIDDDRRQNALQHAGYRILRFTTADLKHRPDSVVGLVKAALTPPRAIR